MDEGRILINIEKRNAASHLAKLLEKEMSHAKKRPIVILCIGSDRATGDALGPLVGYKLTSAKNFGYAVYGTLEKPVHAKNITQVLKIIDKDFQNPFIIAIDACLGNQSQIGYLSLGRGSIKPGAAAGKNLPPVGDIAITGIVEKAGNAYVLQYTRLRTVMKMADIVSKGIKKTIKQIV